MADGAETLKLHMVGRVEVGAASAAITSKTFYDAGPVLFVGPNGEDPIGDEGLALRFFVVPEGVADVENVPAWSVKTLHAGVCSKAPYCA
eukprot:6700487-Alexandrium_andersonii.AAC.1